MGLLQLNAIDTVDAVDEEDEDEDERNLRKASTSDWLRHIDEERSAYLHAVLKLCYERTFRDEVEQLPAPGEWHWDDQRHEDDHFEHQEEENLTEKAVSVAGSKASRWVCLQDCSRASWRRLESLQRG